MWKDAGAFNSKQDQLRSTDVHIIRSEGYLETLDIVRYKVVGEKIGDRQKAMDKLKRGLETHISKLIQATIKRFVRSQEGAFQIRVIVNSNDVRCDKNSRVQGREVEIWVSIAKASSMGFDKQTKEPKPIVDQGIVQHEHEPVKQINLAKSEPDALFDRGMDFGKVSISVLDFMENEQLEK